MGRAASRAYAPGERAGTYVRIWNASRPVGMGFLLDSRHVMTCAHVVGDALGDKTDARARGPAPAAAETVRLDFVLRPVEDSKDAYRAEVVTWRPKGGKAQPADVAVLRILGDVPLPPDTTPIWTYPGFHVGEGFFAFGITKNLPEGTNTRGMIIGEVPPDRIEVMADNAEVAITGGFSGTAIWSAEVSGVIGMAVQSATVTKGLFIPIALLGLVWPGLIKQQSTPAVATASTGRPLRTRLLKDLYSFDRERQTAAFQTAAEDFWAKKGSPVVCAIAGVADDLPMRFRDRCFQHTTHKMWRDNNPQPKKIDWFDPGEWGGVPYALSGLKQQVKSELKATGASVAEIRQACNEGVTPWAFFSVLKEAEFTSLHRDLLVQWIAFWREVGAETLNTPLAVLLIFELESDSRKDTLLGQVLREFGTGLFDYLRPLPRLHDFSPQDVIDWLGAKKTDLDDDDGDTIDKFVSDAESTLTGTLKLKTFETWLRSLPM
jgi:hypothetical protein